MIKNMTEIILDTLIDSIKLLPFLFITYVCMELLEHSTGDKVKRVIQKSGGFGPLLGGVLGIVPQCGFSAAASNLYAGRVITLGTLLAIFLSTSDEMLPILISESVPLAAILEILAWKVCVAILAGFLIDLFYRKKEGESAQKLQQMHNHGHDHCEHGILRSALSHTLQIFVFLLLISFLLNCFMHYFGEEALSGLILNRPVIGVLLAGLVGLIPNCAASVLITKLYLQSAISFGAMMAGLLVGAGVGILILCRVNKDKKECVRIIALLYVIGAAAGILLEFAKIR